MRLLERASERFKEIFGLEEEIKIRSPGRVNLIGEHTDYNDGFVLPCAIDRAIYIIARARDDMMVEVHSLDFNKTYSFHLENLNKGKHEYIEYVKGVAAMLIQDGYEPRGWSGVITGDVPIAAGLSSSAALQMGVCQTFMAVSELDITRQQMALICQRSESEWVGTRVGIMDQLAIAEGQDEMAMLIDCRSLAVEHVPMPSEYTITILDTATRRELESSAYNERRKACEESAAIFGVRALRDLQIEQFEKEQDRLSPTLRKRTRHVLTENLRTLNAAKALREHDMHSFGKLMIQSHNSLRDDFEVSSHELDVMVETALSHQACLGARMTGAGFGGCAVAIVGTEDWEDFRQAVEETYDKRTGLKSRVYGCRASCGVGLI